VLLGIVGWAVIGLVFGFIVSKVLNLRGDDPRLGIISAVGGAIVAGAIYSIASGAGVTAWNFWSLIWAAIGAALGLAIWHGIRSRYVSREPYKRRQSY
jgi:uncharacterized membrane protein YeaQ/YmgE (transglycosylase-associated protein family)